MSSNFVMLDQRMPIYKSKLHFLGRTSLAKCLLLNLWLMPYELLVIILFIKKYHATHPHLFFYF